VLSYHLLWHDKLPLTTPLAKRLFPSAHHSLMLNTTINLYWQVRYRDYHQHQSPVQSHIPSGPYQVVPQVIIIKHSHRRHRDDRHRSHSRSSRPTTVQQPVSYSNPQSQLNYTVTAPRQQYSSSHRTDDFGGSTHPDVPQPHSASYAPAPAKDSDPHSGGDFLCSNCTGRRKALCVSLVKCPNLLPRFPDRHLDWY